jgi:hypothetical protein
MNHRLEAVPENENNHMLGRKRKADKSLFVRVACSSDGSAFRDFGHRSVIAEKEVLSLLRGANCVNGRTLDQMNFYCEKFGAEELENRFSLPSPGIECRLHFRL